MQDMGELAFVVIPIEVFRSLHEEFELLVGEKMAKGVLSRTGFRCGESVIKKMEISCESVDEIPEIVNKIGQEVGLGKFRVVAVEDDKIVIESEESTEANALGRTEKASCDFTRGYIAGTVSTLLGKRYYPTEEKCISKGDEMCMHILSTQLMEE